MEWPCKIQGELYKVKNATELIINYGHSQLNFWKCIQWSKKEKLTARKLQNIFSLMKGEYSYWCHCIVVGILHYTLWLEGEMKQNSDIDTILAKRIISLL